MYKSVSGISGTDGSVCLSVCLSPLEVVIWTGILTVICRPCWLGGEEKTGEQGAEEGIRGAPGRHHTRVKVTHYTLHHPSQQVILGTTPVEPRTALTAARSALDAEHDH